MLVKSVLVNVNHVCFALTAVAYSLIIADGEFLILLGVTVLSSIKLEVSAVKVGDL